jgi:hypothetical protein
MRRRTVAVALALLTGVLASCRSSEPRLPVEAAPVSTAYGRASCTVTGTQDDEVLRGTPGDDAICGLGGNDVLLGGGGDDALIGGSGSDALLGGSGVDDVRGGPGIDLLVGGRGADVLDGGRDEDRCPTGAGDRSASCSDEPTAPVVAAAGDIACEADDDPDEEACRQMATSDLLVRDVPWAVLTLGDNQYDDGELGEFRLSYAASWGRVKAITRPAPGNHDYHVSGAAGYFAYFGPRAGRPDEGFYSFDVGAWHVIALNSNCEEVGCDVGSAQERWLREDLAAHPGACTLAYWHHPRFSSGDHGNDESVDAVWRALYEAGADVVLNGHDHTYERFAPQDPDQRADPDGLRAFVVGTGGKSLYGFGDPEPNSEVRIAAFGILELTLRADGYDWRFISVGGTVEDAGSGSCH